MEWKLNVHSDGGCVNVLSMLTPVEGHVSPEISGELGGHWDLRGHLVTSRSLLWCSNLNVNFFDLHLFGGKL